MAEVNSFNAAELAAGRKIGPTFNGQDQRAIIRWPAVHAFANGDTIGSGVILKRGARLTGIPVLSFGTGAASSTLACGIRDAVTKVATDATAIFAATAFQTAATAMPLTGSKIITGQDYLMLADQEIYFTVAGATPTANQVVRVEVQYMNP